MARDALPKPEVFFHGHDPDGIFYDDQEHVYGDNPDGVDPQAVERVEILDGAD